MNSPFPLMKFVLVSSILASVCLATKRWREPDVVCCNVTSNDGTIDSLKTIIMKQHPELLPPKLVSSKDWSRELAVAFMLGLALGKQCDKPKSTNTSASAESLEKANSSASEESPDDQHEMIKWRLFHTYCTRRKFRVVIDYLGKAVSANLKWKYGNGTYNPVSGLLDIDALLKLESDYSQIWKYPEIVRRLLAQCAKRGLAMVTIDEMVVPCYQRKHFSSQYDRG